MLKSADQKPYSPYNIMVSRKPPYGNNFATSVNVLLEYVNIVFMDFH